MLEEIELRGWKSFDQATIQLGRLTLLVGANASGKSNFVDALRVLKGLALGLDLGACVDGSQNGARGSWPGVRGGLAEATFRNRPGFDLRVRLRSGERVYEHEHVAQTQPKPQIAFETLFEVDSQGSKTLLVDGQPAPSSPLIHSAIAGTLHVVRDKNSEPTSAMPGLVQWFNVSTAAPELSPAIREGVTTIVGIETKLRLLDLSVPALRGYSKAGALIDDQGANLSSTLRTLCGDEERKKDLVDWVSELCAPRVTDIEFIEVEQLGDVMAVLVEEDGTRVSARSMSDGTLRFLGILAVVLSAERGSTLVFEEIEDGLHPTRLHLLLELLERTAQHRGIQIIATTHSPTALRQLSPEALGDVVVFGRHLDASGTVMKRLRDLPRFEELSKSRGVEHLFTTGWLEHAL